MRRQVDHLATVQSQAPVVESEQVARDHLPPDPIELRVSNHLGAQLFRKKRGGVRSAGDRQAG